MFKHRFIDKYKCIRTGSMCYGLEVILFSRSLGKWKVIEDPGSMTDEDNWKRRSQEEESNNLIPRRLANKHEV